MTQSFGVETGTFLFFEVPEYQLPSSHKRILNISMYSLNSINLIMSLMLFFIYAHMCQSSYIVVLQQ